MSKKGGFKPTAAMKKAAMRGLEIHRGGEVTGKTKVHTGIGPIEGGTKSAKDNKLETHTGSPFPMSGKPPMNSTQNVTPRALEIGKKIASGQTLDDKHVQDMAHFHSAHNGNYSDDVSDLLWGGPAGNIWSKKNIMEKLRTGFAEEKIDFDKLISDDDVKLSFEIYSDIELDEPVETDDGRIWAPILRSGMLATRPGPNGEKLDEPLVFVPGHSEDQHKEIGLQDVYDAFKDGAIEHVTIPTSHNNDVLENTGFIRDLKIADSVKFPGEKVILAAHEFTEPDVNDKVQRGTIASRSCGLLYDYKNTTTGKTYPVALEHTALTNKPWMGGMTPYGNSTEFADRTIVPMMLSEKPIKPENIEHKTATELAQEITEPPHSKDKESNSEFLADIQWGEDCSFNDITDQVTSILEKMGSDEDSYPYYFPIDVTNDKVLIKVIYGVGTDNDAWVAPYTVKDKTVELAPFADWIDVTKQWVSDTIDPKEDRAQLDKLKMSDTDLAVLTSKARSKLPSSSFVYPSEKRYPIHDIAHGRNALARVAQNGTPEEQSKVRAAVYRKYPQLKKSKESSTDMTDPLKVASAKRLGLSESKYEPLGGQMNQTTLLSEEQIERLGLSDEAVELVRKQNEAFVKLSSDLSESKKAEKKTRVANRIAELKDEGFDQMPGLLAEIETTMLSDDGDVAVKLQLSEHGHDVEVPETATQITERIIKALPRKDGKVDLGEFAHKTETPELDRPVDKPEDVTVSSKPKTGDDLAAQWLADDPTLAKDPAFAGLKLSSDNGKGQ